MRYGCYCKNAEVIMKPTKKAYNKLAIVSLAISLFIVMVVSLSWIYYQYYAPSEYGLDYTTPVFVNLLTSLTAINLLLGMVTIALGAIAIVQCIKRRERGRRLAITSIAVAIIYYAMVIMTLLRHGFD